MIDKNQVEYLGNLCKLKFSEEEKEKYSSELSKILDYVHKLEEVDTDNAEPLYRVYDYNQVFREDVVEEGLSREEVLQNTSEKQYGYFKLFNIME